MRIFVCAAVCVLTTAGSAAPARAQGVEGGVKGGITSSTLSVTGLPGFEPESKVGALGGAWLSAGRDTVRLQVELLFATRKFSAPSPGGDIEVSSRGVDVPVLGVMRWRPEQRARPLLFAGPYVTFISSPKQAVGGVETDLDSEIKNADVGAVFGLGVEVRAGRGAIVLDTRFAFGFRDLSESSDTTFKSRTVMASIGYRF